MPAENKIAEQRGQASNVAIITPTKGRHTQLRCLLETLSRQTTIPAQIIIADGGRDASKLVAEFSDRLPVCWLDCPQAGQIAQRNLALTHLKPDISIVIYFDDDIQLETDAIEKLLIYWNGQVAAPAGMSFNITNMPRQADNFWRHLFFMQTDLPGKVLTSGYNSPVTGIAHNIQSQWLIGGATAWRKDILTNQINESIPSRWAITEDLMFSYAISKIGEKLFVCADARVKHVDSTPVETFSAGYFRGSNATLWRYMFVARNPELSKVKFFWMMSGQMIARFAAGFMGKFWNFGYAFGHARALPLCIISLLFRIDIRKFLR